MLKKETACYCVLTTDIDLKDTAVILHTFNNFNLIKIKIIAELLGELDTEFLMLKEFKKADDTDKFLSVLSAYLPLQLTNYFEPLNQKQYDMVYSFSKLDFTEKNVKSFLELYSGDITLLRESLIISSQYLVKNNIKKRR